MVRKKMYKEIKVSGSHNKRHNSHTLFTQQVIQNNKIFSHTEPLASLLELTNISRVALL